MKRLFAVLFLYKLPSEATGRSSQRVVPKIPNDYLEKAAANGRSGKITAPIPTLCHGFKFSSQQLH